MRFIIKPKPNKEHDAKKSNQSKSDRTENVKNVVQLTDQNDVTNTIQDDIEITNNIDLQYPTPFK